MFPETISVSQISLYRTCSLKYRFTYWDKLPGAHVSGNVVYGRAMAAALEWLHKARKRGRNPSCDEILRVFQADWHAQCLDHNILFEEDGGALLLIRGKELLARYYHLPTKPVREAELFFHLPLVNPFTGEVLEVPLRGVMDCVYEDDTLDEFKASAKSWSLTDLPDNIQLTAYAYAFAKLFGKPPAELRLVNLVRTKTPKIETLMTDREPRDFERLFHLAKEVLKGIRSGVFIPNRGCWMCRDCEYDGDCREWTGNEEVMPTD